MKVPAFFKNKYVLYVLVLVAIIMTSEQSINSSIELKNL